MDVSKPPPTYDETYGANQQYPPPVGYPTPQGYPQPGTQYPPPQGYPQPGAQYPLQQGYPQPGVQYPPVQGYPQQGVQYPPTTVVTANQPYGNVTVVDQTLPPGTCFQRHRVFIIMAVVMFTTFIIIGIIMRSIY